MKNQNLVDKVYKLKRNAAPLSFMLPGRSTRRNPLLWFDEEKGINRSLRYARNQRSPFEDEQDGNAIIEPIIFEDGMLRVPKTNPVLQQFLHYHPMNGVKFEEVNTEKDAEQQMNNLNIEVDALIEARSLSIAQLEMISRAVFGKDPSTITTAELKRDVLVFAKTEPQAFMDAINDPDTKLYGVVHSLLDANVIKFKNNKRDVYYNTSTNKKKMISVPYADDPIHTIASYFKTDEGVEILQALEKKLDN